MSKIDYYGFDEKSQYNRKLDYPVKSLSQSLTKEKVTKFVMISFSVIFIAIILFMFSFSGYIAWNSFTNDPVWLKISKTYLAVLFSPVFLFYIFLRSIVFKLPN